MAATERWNDIIAFWRQSGVPIRAGASVGELEAFQRKCDVILPADFAGFLRTVDGSSGDLCNNLHIFLALAELKPVHEVLDDHHRDRYFYPNCYVFIDYFYSSWFYAIELTSDVCWSGAVYKVTGCDAPAMKLTASFSEFIDRYLDHPDSIL